MKIKEILDLSLQKPVADIAKDHLKIGEKLLRKTLKEIGCEQNKGKRGWRYEGEDIHILEKSIYEFAPSTKGKATNVRTKEVMNEELDKELERSRKLLETMKKQVAVTAEVTKETTNVIRKRASFDLDVQLLKELKVKAVLNDRNVYEIVEDAVRKYLKEME